MLPFDETFIHQRQQEIIFPSTSPALCFCWEVVVDLQQQHGNARGNQLKISAQSSLLYAAYLLASPPHLFFKKTQDISFQQELEESSTSEERRRGAGTPTGHLHCIPTTRPHPDKYIQQLPYLCSREKLLQPWDSALCRTCILGWTQQLLSCRRASTALSLGCNECNWQLIGGSTAISRLRAVWTVCEWHTSCAVFVYGGVYVFPFYLFIWWLLSAKHINPGGH